MKNPVVPYILIMAFGIGLIFFMSIYGVDKQEEIALENGEEQSSDSQSETQADSNKAFDPESFVQESCIGCHGNALEGAFGPALKGTSLSKDEIVEVLQNGKGQMPAFKDVDQAAIADYILSLE
ncbi:c-type cytochrome [Chungangia koreensis]|uniref:C-type cytochrome n=1 Tax=Chungangia koreensis TaxID=752657 RepID=A0ABV8X6D0_9LACT